MSGGSFFDSIGPWVAGLTYDALPAAVDVAVRHAIVDYLGVAVAGSRHELADRMMRYLADSSLTADDACTLIGRSERSGVEGAALYNAVVGHVLDFDDSSDTLGGHPTVVMLPAVLALAEVRGPSGSELLTAYAAGVETAAHIADQVNIAHYERGWHPTATLGIFGTAAACAKLLGLDGEGVAAALAITTAAPSGMRAHFGTHMKSVQVGEAARKGLTAALMAASGIRGGADAFEHEQGFGAIYNAEAGFHRAPFDPSPDRTWDLVEPGLTIKQYPCCASTHPAVDAALHLRDDPGIAAPIERIRIRLHPRRLRHTDRPDPRTPLEGKFSVQYVVATALATGGVTLGDFTPEALTRPEVRTLLDRTAAEVFPPEEYGPDHYAGEVQLTLEDGSVLSHRVPRARGRGTLHALSADEITRKFRGCVSPVFGPDRADEILMAIEDLPRADHTRGLMRLLAAPPGA